LEDKLQQLKRRLIEAGDLAYAQAVLGWDQSTYLPDGGAPARGRQLGLLQTLAHERFTDPAVGRLLDELQPYADSLPYDSDDASLIRVTRRNYERLTKVPSAFVAEIAEHGAISYTAWAQARPANDFARVAPLLEKTLDYSRRLADYFPGYQHVSDPLIDMSDYGMKAESVRAIFAQLRDRLVPLVEQVAAQEPIDDSVIKQFFPKDGQLAFGEKVARELGYDFNRGRLDLTHHPFMTKFSIGDVRITTRVNEYDFGDCFFSIVHETGHALYEQGINPAFEALPLDTGTSAGVHESQSRLWENIVGRSYGFWEYMYPQAQAAFPEQLGNVDLDTFYRAFNKVQRSLIRVDADELTYNLHVMLRFELELEMLEGSLSVRDLPEAWQDSYERSIGVTAPDDRDGVLQDVHWYSGQIGGVFQGYTLGNILSGLFYSAALKAQPDIPQQIQRGEFKPLLSWLQQNIYQHGAKFTTSELVERVTGGELTIEPYLDYLTEKYGRLYSLQSTP
jgi:carboxypeptidase Taq